MMLETPPPLSRRRKGGRPKGDPAAVRAMTIGVRVSPSEYTDLKDKATQMGLTPAQWLRQAALSRRLPSPPVPAINRSVYADLARLSANLNQLARHANRGESVQVDADLLRRLAFEARQLRLALIGAGGQP
jgi:hypothetical protein